jgi:class 3 adenylate cyclase
VAPLENISNRNTKIIATYVVSKIGGLYNLFEGLPFPEKEYESAEEFFLNEDEWTTHENFDLVFRRARSLVDEPFFFFKCGASAAPLRSWGRFSFFEKVFATPNDGFRRVPFFNRTFNETKDIELIVPPTFDHQLRKFRTILKVETHEDIDPNRDYIRDPYLRGILASIPTLWGMPRARVKQPLNPYDPVVLFNQEPEFLPFALDVRMERDLMTLKHPEHGQRAIVGQKVILTPHWVNDKRVYLGSYVKKSLMNPGGVENGHEAILITDTVKKGNQIILKAGEFFQAPYFILDITYDRISAFNRLSQIFSLEKRRKDSAKELADTVTRLKKSIKAKNEFNRLLKKTNEDLAAAKQQLDDYARGLEMKVEERTQELRSAQDELILLNRSLESKVARQVKELERYNELRRYVSPKLTEKILSSGQHFGEEHKRKLMTILFSDIRGFSQITDCLEPEEIFCLMNRYISEMTKLVHQYDGTLNKMIGDGLLVFFGDPIALEDHAQRAVLMAIDMQKKVTALRDDWQKFGHDLGVGIGINTGYVTVGSIGSDAHKDYTVLGNQVNVASRLESHAKSGQILISQRTYSHVQGDIEVEQAREIQVKGIHAPIKVYSVKV